MSNMSLKIIPEFEMFLPLFMTEVNNDTPQEFAQRSGVHMPDLFEEYMHTHGWAEKRIEYRQLYYQKASDAMEKLGVGEITNKLIQIQALKAKAFDEALKKTFKDAGQAISSYIDLEKLERLMMGESTENIKVTDLDKYMIGVATIIRRNISDEAVLQPLIEELSKFTFSDAKRMEMTTN